MGIKNKLTKKLAVSFAALTIGASIIPSKVETVNLTDLDQGHWATPNIKWSVNQKIVDGFKLSDGTHIYKKDTNVTE